MAGTLCDAALRSGPEEIGQGPNSAPPAAGGGLVGACVGGAAVGAWGIAAGGVVAAAGGVVRAGAVPVAVCFA
jgi:hypothetical protein